MTKRINTRIDYKAYNAQSVLYEVERYIRILEMKHNNHYRWSRKYKLKMWDCCDDLSIFDWWVDDLSISRLKEMRIFLKEAIKLGYTGYVCFKVGVSGCANGMWANKLPSTNGYSPNCEFLYRSFTTDYTYWDVTYMGGGCLSKKVGKRYDELKTIRDLEKAIKEVA